MLHIIIVLKLIIIFYKFFLKKLFFLIIFLSFNMSKMSLKKTKLKIKDNLPIFTTVKIKLKSSSNILKNYLNSSKNIFSTKNVLLS